MTGSQECDIMGWLCQAVCVSIRKAVTSEGGAGLELTMKQPHGLEEEGTGSEVSDIIRKSEEEEVTPTGSEEEVMSAESEVDVIPSGA